MGMRIRERAWEVSLLLVNTASNRKLGGGPGNEAAQNQDSLWSACMVWRSIAARGGEVGHRL